MNGTEFHLKKLLKQYGNKKVIIIDADKILDEIKLKDAFNKPDK
jgi:hypothetical protein